MVEHQRHQRLNKGRLFNIEQGRGQRHEGQRGRGRCDGGHGLRPRVGARTRHPEPPLQGTGYTYTIWVRREQVYNAVGTRL